MDAWNCLIEEGPVLNPSQAFQTEPKTDKYLMKTFRALVRVQNRGRTNYVKTEVRAESQQDARWLLWAQYGFHSIYSGPDVVNTRLAA